MLPLFFFNKQEKIPSDECRNSRGNLQTDLRKNFSSVKHCPKLELAPL